LIDIIEAGLFASLPGLKLSRSYPLTKTYHFWKAKNLKISYTTTYLSLLAEMTVYKYLIRFKDASGTVLFGEAGGPVAAEALLGKKVPVYKGTSPWDPNMEAMGEIAEVTALLCPMEDSSIALD
jgi:hypothetical protein